MRSIATVTTPPAETRLTTLSTFKAELNITSVDNDALLERKIDEATSDIEAHLARTLCRAGITETFWGDNAEEFISLDRWPVATITSVTEDGVVIASSEYRLDAAAGLLYRLDASGYPCSWNWSKSLVIVYAGGFIMPGESNRDLPAALESGALDLVASFWQSRGRDPLVRAEDVPGVLRTEYWVGSVGEAGSLPPGVLTKIAPFRRPAR